MAGVVSYVPGNLARERRRLHGQLERVFVARKISLRPWFALPPRRLAVRLQALLRRQGPSAIELRKAQPRPPWGRLRRSCAKDGPRGYAQRDAYGKSRASGADRCADWCAGA